MRVGPSVAVLAVAMMVVSASAVSLRSGALLQELVGANLERDTCYDRKGLAGDLEQTLQNTKTAAIKLNSVLDSLSADQAKAREFVLDGSLEKHYSAVCYQDASTSIGKVGTLLDLLPEDSAEATSSRERFLEIKKFVGSVCTKSNELMIATTKDIARVGLEVTITDPDYVVILGCVDPIDTIARVDIATRYYNTLGADAKGKVKFVASGQGFWRIPGVYDKFTSDAAEALRTKYDTVLEGAEFTEARFMQTALRKNIPDLGADQIILDEEARDTIGNAVFSLLEIMKNHEAGGGDSLELVEAAKKVVLVSSTNHIVRAFDFYTRVFPGPWALEPLAVSVKSEWVEEDTGADKLVPLVEGGLRSVSMSVQNNFLLTDLTLPRMVWLGHGAVAELLLHMSQEHGLYNGVASVAANHQDYRQALLDKFAEFKAKLEDTGATPVNIPNITQDAKVAAGRKQLQYYLSKENYGDLIAKLWGLEYSPECYGGALPEVAGLRADVPDPAADHGDEQLASAQVNGDTEARDDAAARESADGEVAPGLAAASGADTGAAEEEPRVSGDEEEEVDAGAANDSVGEVDSTIFSVDDEAATVDDKAANPQGDVSRGAGKDAAAKPHHKREKKPHCSDTAMRRGRCQQRE